jgi:hypothetical protein
MMVSNRHFAIQRRGSAGVSFEKYYDSKVDMFAAIVDVQLAALKELFEFQLKAIDEKTALAKGNMERRLAGMNEIKDAMNDQLILIKSMTATFITKADYETRHQDLATQIHIIERLQANLATKLELENKSQEINKSLRQVEDFKTTMIATERQVSQAAKKSTVTFTAVIAVIGLTLSLASVIILAVHALK